MRNSFLFFLILTIWTAASAQQPAPQLKEHPILKIKGFHWLAFEGGPITDNWPGGAAVTNVAGAISLGVSPMNASGNGTVVYSTPNRGRDFPIKRGRFPFTCRAVLTLQNTGNKTIRAVHLDYVFRDRVTRQEFLRYQFRANHRIKPGQTKKLKHEIYERVGEHRKSFLPITPGLDVVLRTQEAQIDLLIRRIEYVDGTSSEF